MQLSILLLTAAFSSFASAQITYTLTKSSNPSSEESAAYTKITAAMDAAVQRHEDNNSNATKSITVTYNTGVKTADSNINGALRFGANTAFMTERTALHEISHTLGVGQTQAFTDNCDNNGWTTATALLKTFDGADAAFGCGGSHFWPYGLNYENEMSDTNANRHVEIINAMLEDGLAG